MINGKRIPNLETAHYRLRGVCLKDAPCLFKIMGDRETMKYITPHPVLTIVEMEKRIEGQLEKCRNGSEIPWVIIHKPSEKVIGTVRFHKVDLWHKRAEIGVVIRNDFQRKGVMTELMPVLLRFGFQRLELNRIAGDIFAENIGSKRLLEKFGFQREGRFRQTDFDGERFHDTIVYSMLKEAYEKQWKTKS